MLNQISIFEPTEVYGINLYNWDVNKATFYPAEEDEGIARKVKDIEKERKKMDYYY